MRRWTYSTDARDIGILYLLISAFSGMLGTTLSMFIRLELMDINQSSVLNMPNQLYNVVITVHALLMIFYLIMPSLFGGFGNIKDIPISENTINNKYNNNNLGPYLAGLIEGDGSIYIPNLDKVYYNNKNQKLYPNPKIQIIFHINDLKLALHLKEILNCGNVYKKNNYCIWSIQSINDIIIIIKIINGYMRTPKINSLNKLIQWVNKNNNLNIKIYDIDKSPINSNNWLSGLIDANGSFSINLLKRKNSSNFRTQLFFRLEMKQLYKSNVENTLFFILTDISNYLCTNLLTRIRKTNYSTFIVISHSQNSHKLLINYLNLFPLFSSKFNNYQDWLKVYEIILKKEHLTNEGKEKIFNIKSNFKRTIFNWNHLKYLKLP